MEFLINPNIAYIIVTACGMLALITSAWLGEWIVAAIIALMLAGGEALEEAASARASAAWMAPRK